ncbi:MAG: S41 family peptidase [Prevotellaceae bacterium]|jgi:carboxyl-terminal processing protease|nr:S41 family peptidase [Prevotellaceae bacterium]
MKRPFLILTSLFLSLPIFSQYYVTPQMQKLNMAAMAINSFYVDTVKEEKLVEAAIVSMLEELDPHSSYMSAEEAKRANEPLEGNFDGIGIQFQMLEDTLFVVQTISGGPSERVGIIAGDRILFVNDTVIAGVKMQNSGIMKRLRGKKGTTVIVKVLRRGEPKLIEFKIVRDKIPIYSLDAAYMLDNETGYIKLNRFAATTQKEFLEALLKLKNKGMRNLILDLQGNGGGYLNAATQLADEFLKNNQLIVYTEGLHQRRMVESATSRGDFETGRLVVLIDESSASASEILSGAIQDWDRGIVVGRRSFGKGLVQRPIPLNDGSQMRLTVARYYTPAGRSIQKPYKDGNEKYQKDLIERYNHGELLHEDSIAFPDSLRKATLVHKRIVYGGGGIMPDIFVPLDTTRYTAYHRSIINKGVMNKTAINIVDKNRNDFIRKYPDFAVFNAQFTATDSILVELLDNAEKDSIKFNEEQYNKSKPLIVTQLKALIARDLWTMNEYFEIINAENEPLTKAFEIIGNPKEYDKILSTSKEVKTVKKKK